MKANKATIRARVDDVYRIRLDGAEFPDILQYVAEREAAGEAPWAMPDGGKPLSERQLWRYVAQSDRLLKESALTNRKKRLRLHFARRKSLYARAIATGQLNVALAVLKDLATLEGFYGDELAREVEALRREVDELKRYPDDDGNGDPPAPDEPPPRPGAPEGGADGDPGPPPPAGGPEPHPERGRIPAGLLAADVAPLDL